MSLSISARGIMSEVACSVLLPVYSGDNVVYLKLALESLVKQTRKAEEVVVVVDGFIPDSLMSLIHEFEGALPLTLVFLDENMGLGAALNKGLAVARFPLVMRMDADDVCESDRIEKQVEFLTSNPDVDVVGSCAIEVDSNGVKRGRRKVPSGHSKIVGSLWACPLIHPTVMYRKDRVLLVGGYDSTLRRRQDYELWFRCAKKGLVFENLQDTLLLYRFGAGSHKKQPARLAFQQGLIGYKGCRDLKLPLWKAVACFVPFFRSLLPSKLQHVTYRLMSVIDPRKA